MRVLHRCSQSLHDQHPTLLRSDPQPVTDMEQFNTRVPPFNNVLARQAVNYATDRNELVRRTGGPELTSPTCQLLPPNFPGHHDYCPFGLLDTTGHYAGPDMAKAQELITQSGTRGQHVIVDVNAFDQVHPTLRILRRPAQEARIQGHGAHDRPTEEGQPDPLDVLPQLGRTRYRSSMPSAGRPTSRSPTTSTTRCSRAPDLCRTANGTQRQRVLRPRHRPPG